MSLFDFDSKENRINEIDKLSSASNFWDDPKRAQILLEEEKNLKNLKSSYENLLSKSKYFCDELSLTEIDSSIEFLNLLDEELETLEKEVHNFELQVLLTDENDKCNAIIEIHPGAGGTESQDWAMMLYDMYVKYAANNNFKIETLNYEPAIDAGIKSVSFLVKGLNAYGYLKCERGVHRLVRISPFDASGRRHTSFASVDVIPELIDSSEISINETELKIDTYRASGAGGQHVNKTDSAVRITHIPTGIVVTCQNQRSQIQNKEKCLETLKSKLLVIKKQEEESKLNNIRGELKSIEWGSQIRSYVFCPYTLVKDHRTEYEENSVIDVMNGKLDGFIYEYLKKRL